VLLERHEHWQLEGRRMYPRFRYATGGCVSAVENTLRLVASLVTGKQYSQSLATPYRCLTGRYRVP